MGPVRDLSILVGGLKSNDFLVLVKGGVHTESDSGECSKLPLGMDGFVFRLSDSVMNICFGSSGGTELDLGLFKVVVVMSGAIDD